MSTHAPQGRAAALDGHAWRAAPLRGLVSGFGRSMRWPRWPRLLQLGRVRAGRPRWIKDFAGFARGRSLPPVGETDHSRRGMRRRIARRSVPPRPRAPVLRRVHELHRQRDRHQGGRACSTRRLYEVVIPPHARKRPRAPVEGTIRDARAHAARNELLAPLITAESPLIGIEPSAIPGFRDEYPDLVPTGTSRSCPRTREARAAH